MVHPPKNLRWELISKSKTRQNPTKDEPCKYLADCDRFFKGSRHERHLERLCGGVKSLTFLFFVGQFWTQVSGQKSQLWRGCFMASLWSPPRLLDWRKFWPKWWNWKPHKTLTCFKWILTFIVIISSELLCRVIQVLTFLKGGKFEKISRWMWEDQNYKEVHYCCNVTRSLLAANSSWSPFGPLYFIFQAVWPTQITSNSPTNTNLFR